MIDWLLDNHRGIVGWSRWICAGCALALVAIAGLPRGPIDRVIAIVGLALIAAIFVSCLTTVVVFLVRPRLFDRIRARRAEARGRAL